MSRRVLCQKIGGEAPLLDYLLAYYNFNNNVNDITGNGFNGTGNLIDYVAGKSAEAVRFNGANDYVDIADSDDLSFTNGVNDLPFSFSFYYYKPSSGNAVFLSKRSNSITSSEYQIDEVSGNLRFFLCTDTVSNQISAQVTSPSSGVWVHVVYTYSGSGLNTGLNIYIDGTVQSVTLGSTGTYTGMVNGITQVRLGRLSFTDANRLVGNIDGLGIWTKELSQEEVTEIYNTQNAGNELI